MRKILALFALLAGLVPATAQLVPFPQSLPPSTVVGRTGISAGPAQAIPFSVFTPLLASSVFAYITNGNSDFVIPSTARTIATSAALTAPRTWTLPASGVMTPGQPVCIVDVAGGVTSTNTLTIARSGADTINGATSFVLRAAFAGVCLIPDGTTKWNTVSAVDTLAGLAPANRALFNTDGSGVPFLTSQPIIGVNGGTGGQITFNGATSGSLAARVAAVAGASTIFQFPATNGTASQVLLTDGTGITSWGSPIDVQVFTATGANTWTRANGVTVVRVIICGGGGGGGGGGRAAAATAVAGGGGGGGGYCNEATYKAADAGASQTVTVAVGGTSGAGSTVNGNPGVTGGVGGNTTFGTLLTAPGGGAGGGGGGTNIGGGGGAGGGPTQAGGAGLTTGASANGGCSEFWGGAATTGCTNVALTAGPCAGGSGFVTATGLHTGCPNGGSGGGASGTAAATPAAGPGTTAGGLHPGGGGSGGPINNANGGAQGGNGGRSIGCPTATIGGATGVGGNTTAPDFNYHPGCGGSGGGGGVGTPASGGNGGNGTAGAGAGGGGAGNAANAGNGGTGGNGFALIASW